MMLGKPESKNNVYDNIENYELKNSQAVSGFAVNSFY